jgi:hypothetical protein
MKRYLYIFIYILVTNQVFSLEIKDFAVLIKADIDTINHRITLNWQNDTAAYDYLIYKKLKSDSVFGDPIAKLQKTTLSFSDTLLPKVSVEYKIEKELQFSSGFGYINAGYQIEEIYHRGKVLVLVDETQYSKLTTELQQLKIDLIADGWNVKIKQSPRADEFDKDKVSKTKQIITDTYKDWMGFDMLILFGRVPVAYSGSFAVDGHTPDHDGAWPTDVYYADIDGKWTDTLTNVKSEVLRTQNKAGDGKFDQLMIPSSLELELGRIDLYNLPAFTKNETELLRQYLIKTSEFKNGKFDIARRANITDNFGISFTEAFAASGWMNFYPLFGEDSINIKNMVFEVMENDYLFVYGCGSGSYNSAYQAAYTINYSSSPVRAAFSMIFGSYHGDWDSKDNVLRAFLAGEPYGFTSAWAGRPHWFFHHLAQGENIGYSTRLTQNVYPSNYGAASPYARRMNHIALMGDPSLRLHYFKKPDSLKVDYYQNYIKLSWIKSIDSNVIGYNIYRADDIDGNFRLINNKHIAGNEFIDSMPLLGNNIYMVRAVKLEITPSGSYYNQSLGIFSGNILFPIELSKDENIVLITPNPIKENSKIAIKSNTLKSLKIEIFNIAGQKVKSFPSINITSGYLILDWNISDDYGNILPSGVYYLRLINEKSIYKTINFVIAR